MWFLFSQTLHRIWNKKTLTMHKKGSLGLCYGVSPSLTDLFRFPLSSTLAWCDINTLHSVQQHLVLISWSRPLKSQCCCSVIRSLPLSLTSNMLSAAILLSGFSMLITLQWFTYHRGWHTAHHPSLSVFQSLIQTRETSVTNFNVMFQLYSNAILIVILIPLR